MVLIWFLFLWDVYTNRMQLFLNFVLGYTYTERWSVNACYFLNDSEARTWLLNLMDGEIEDLRFIYLNDAAETSQMFSKCFAFLALSSNT